MIKVVGGRRVNCCDYCGQPEIPIPHADGATVPCRCAGAEKAAAKARKRRAKRMKKEVA